MASTAAVPQERSMIVEARLTHDEAASLYEAAQRLRKISQNGLYHPEIRHDLVKVCDFIQENI